MSETFTGFAYLIAAVCFILALRGLSSPESARKGNMLGIAGMVIAIGTTLADPSIMSFELIIAGIVIGGLIGTVVALKIEMTALPQLVAAFHSLVGLAAVFVAAAAFFAPEAYGIGVLGNIQAASLIEMSLGTAIGAITFSGSLIAFGKLQGVLSGAPLVFKGQHALNALLAIALVAIFGQSLQSIIAAIAFLNIPIYLRLMRSQVMSIRRMRFVEASYVAGTPDRYIILRHVIPNSMAPVLAQLSVNIGWSVLLTAGLSFVGAGVVAPTPEWGSMIAMGFQNIITGQWWPSVFPGIALAVTVFGFALVGASIEVLADPARRRAMAGTMRQRRTKEA